MRGHDMSEMNAPSEIVSYIAKLERENAALKAMLMDLGGQMPEVGDVTDHSPDSKAIANAVRF